MKSVIAIKTCFLDLRSRNLNCYEPDKTSGGCLEIENGPNVRRDIISILVSFKNNLHVLIDIFVSIHGASMKP